MDTPKLRAPNLHVQVEETCLNAWPALKEVFSSEARGKAGEFASVAFCGIHQGMACVQWVVTDPERRRLAFSHPGLWGLWARARAAGARGPCWQVLALNAPAIALYKRLGFGC